MLFWNVMFFIVLSSSAIGLLENALGTELGPGQWFNALATLLAGVLWWMCRRARGSVRFCRFMEVEALLVHGVLGILLVRYSAGQFLAERSVETAEGAFMADGLFLMMAQGGAAMLAAIRAALIPSQPRRTAWVTVLYGSPSLLATILLATPEGGALSLRGLDSEIFPWWPGMSLMMWAYATVTCTVISSVLYGLRREVRRANLLGQYVLERKLGEGGIGEVFVARHGLMRRPSAIKLL